MAETRHHVKQRLGFSQRDLVAEAKIEKNTWSTSASERGNIVSRFGGEEGVREEGMRKQCEIMDLTDCLQRHSETVLLFISPPYVVLKTTKGFKLFFQTSQGHYFHSSNSAENNSFRL